MRSSSLVLAVVVAVALVLSAPFVGQIRAYIRAEFPGHFVLVVGSIIAAGLCAALLAAVWRIRDRRAQRFGAIGLALLIAAAYSIRNARDNPESNVVELFHFLQYGLIAFLFYRAWRPLGDFGIILLPTLAGLMVGTAEEWLQWFIPNRVGEMADVLLNLVALASGLLFSLAIDPPGRRFLSLSAGSRQRAGLLATAALLAFAAFFHVVHLGHVLQDEEVGAFESRYSVDHLLRLQRERAFRWRVTPPSVTLVRLSREDQYLTEGVQHVRRRNRLWDAGDIRGAWLENRILEKYYDPVLDTPTHEGAGHRWPAGQRTDAESRGASTTAVGPFVSEAYPSRIYPWSKGLFWAVIGVLAGLLLIATRSQGRGAFIAQTSD
jgi:VanZ family protein